MESVTKLDWINDYKKVEVKKDTRTTKEMLEDLTVKFEELEKMQRYSLTEQQKIHIRTLNIEELSKLLLENQLQMKKSIDYIIEKSNKIWGEK